VAAIPPSTPHWTSHVAVGVQLTVHPPAQSMLQVVESAQMAVLPAPRLSLHSALSRQTARAFAPAFSSHFDEDEQVIWLPSPPIPLHSDVSPQTTVVGPVDEALHLEAVSHVIEHPAEPQLALQSVPAMQ
jgi:hypothetical protein